MHSQVVWSHMRLDPQSTQKIAYGQRTSGEKVQVEVLEIVVTGPLDQIQYKTEIPERQLLRGKGFIPILL